MELTSIVLERLSSRLQSVSVGPGEQPTFQFFPRLFTGVEVRAAGVPPNQTHQTMSLWISRKPSNKLLLQMLKAYNCLNFTVGVTHSGIDLSIRLPDSEAWFITPENTCPLLQWLQCSLHHSGQHLVLCIVTLGLCAAAQPWKPILWSSTCTVLILLLEAV